MYEKGMAWHRTFADAWASTPWSKELDPQCDKLRQAIKEAEKQADTEEKKIAVKQAWFHLINAENSDGRWPPPPLSPAECNIQYCRDHLTKGWQEIARFLSLEVPLNDETK